jgi:hypothetical protein
LFHSSRRVRILKVDVDLLPLRPFFVGIGGDFENGKNRNMLETVEKLLCNKKENEKHQSKNSATKSATLFKTMNGVFILVAIVASVCGQGQTLATEQYNALMQFYKDIGMFFFFSSLLLQRPSVVIHNALHFTGCGGVCSRFQSNEPCSGPVKCSLGRVVSL